MDLETFQQCAVIIVRNVSSTLLQVLIVSIIQEFMNFPTFTAREIGNEIMHYYDHDVFSCLKVTFCSKVRDVTNFTKNNFTKLS